MQGIEARLLELAGDVLTALGRGELAPDAPVVRAAAAALAELRRVPAPASSGATPGAASVAAAGGGSMGSSSVAVGSRSARATPPAVEQILAVAARMRVERRSFATACATVAEELGSSAQAVRNACTRWLGVSAAEWQPLLVDGGIAGVVPLARRVAERCPWLTERIAREFGVAAAAIAPAGPAAD